MGVSQMFKDKSGFKKNGSIHPHPFGNTKSKVIVTHLCTKGT